MGFGVFKSLVLSHLYCPRKDSCVLTQGFKGGSPFLRVSACVICPAIKQEIELLLGPSLPEYVNFVEKYKNDNATLENAENLKKCVDSNLTKVDKENCTQFTGEFYCVCHCPRSCPAHPS